VNLLFFNEESKPEGSIGEGFSEGPDAVAQRPSLIGHSQLVRFKEETPPRTGAAFDHYAMSLEA